MTLLIALVALRLAAGLLSVVLGLTVAALGTLSELAVWTGRITWWGLRVLLWRDATQPEVRTAAGRSDLRDGPSAVRDDRARGARLRLHASVLRGAAVAVAARQGQA
jgi:hypothetical protein